jgi:acyl carrier protein
MECELGRIVEIVAGFVGRTRGVPASSVSPDTHLLQEGLLDSFALVELIADLEQSLGVSLEEGALLPEDFDTPKTLFERLQQI